MKCMGIIIKVLNFKWIFQDTFNFLVSSTISFAPYCGVTWSPDAFVFGRTGAFGADDATTDDLMLYNPQTNKPIIKDGEVVRIKSGKNYNYDTLEASVQEILKLLDENEIKYTKGELD